MNKGQNQLSRIAVTLKDEDECNVVYNDYYFLSYLFVLIFSVFTLFENDGPGGRPRVFKVKDVFPVREHQDASQVKLMWKKGRANYLILTF